MSNLKNKMEAIKNKEAGVRGPATHGYQEQDVLLISGVEQVKGGKSKIILANRLFVVVGDSVKPDLVRGILLDGSNNLQNCVISLPVSSMTKVGKYTDEGEVVLDQVESQPEASQPEVVEKKSARKPKATS
jgi:hypothetical protein